MLGLGAYLVYKFSGVFSAVADTATAAAESATSGVREHIAAATDKAKVAKAAPGATAEQIAGYKADAATLAAAFGTAPGFNNYLIEDLKTAFSVVKRYSRLMLYNNKPYDVTTKKEQAAETKSSAQRKVNCSVLVPFYKDATSGRDLYADVHKFFNKGFNSPYSIYIKWIL